MNFIPKDYLHKISHDEKLREVMRNYCDVDFNLSDHQKNIIAKSADGGSYLIGEEQDVYYLSSEGEAGKIAENLKSFLLLVITMPYWKDMLKFSDGGKLDEMKKASVFLEKEWNEEFGNKEQIEKELLKSLLLEKKKNTIEILLSTVESAELNYIQKEENYASLIGNFKTTDNPFWRGKK